MFGGVSDFSCKYTHGTSTVGGRGKATVRTTVRTDMVHICIIYGTYMILFQGDVFKPKAGCQYQQLKQHGKQHGFKATVVYLVPFTACVMVDVNIMRLEL